MLLKKLFSKTYYNHNFKHNFFIPYYDSAEKNWYLINQYSGELISFNLKSIIHFIKTERKLKKH